MFVCVRERGRNSMFVCVCERERERKKECVCMREQFDASRIDIQCMFDIGRRRRGEEKVVEVEDPHLIILDSKFFLPIVKEKDGSRLYFETLHFLSYSK